MGGLEIAHFPHHDDVGVLAQDRPQGGGESDPRLFVDLDLADPGEVVLDGVFHRDDVHFGPGKHLQDRVEGGRLPGSGGPREEDHSVGPGNHPLEGRSAFPGHAELFERQEPFPLVEQPQGQPFPVLGRNGPDADVDGSPPHGDADAAVLRGEAFRDVHPRHDLDPRGERGLVRFREGQLVVEDPVHPEPDLAPVLEGFHVDVRGALLHGLEEEAVHQADDGGGHGIALDVLPGCRIEVLHSLYRLHVVGGDAAPEAVKAVEEAVQEDWISELDPGFPLEGAGEELGVAVGFDRRHPKDQVFPVPAQREDARPPEGVKAQGCGYEREDFPRVRGPFRHCCFTPCQYRASFFCL